MDSLTKLFNRYFMGENVQITAACSMFLALGLLGAKFYEKMGQVNGIKDEEKSSYYTREQFLRFVAYVLGVAPLLILLASGAYGAAKEADKAKNNHMFVYLLYTCVGVIGLGISAMIMADISKYRNADKKSSFGADDATTGTTKPEKSETDKAIDNAKIAAIAGLLIFALHVLLSLTFAFTDNNDVYSLNAFKSLQNLVGGSKSSASAAPKSTTGFGMNDLLSFGKRRRRY